MKRIFSIIFILAVSIINTSGQPKAIPFQGAARDASGAMLSNRTISLRLSVLDSASTGTMIYSETHSTSTSALGLFTVNVGTGNPSLGSFDMIDWGNNDKYLSVELDTNNTASYVLMGITQMLSVPYALYSKSSGTKIGFRANIIQATIPANTTNNLQFGSIVFNDGNGMDSTGFTAPESGLYHFNVSVYWSALLACTSISTYLIKGASIVDRQLDYFCNGAVVNSKFSNQIYLQAGESIRVRMVHNQNPNANIAVGQPSIFSGYKIY
ncbi:MAG: hypothetical protein EYC69_09345 [Bacteroidetes bacterium]|nr:MAG: hypothetical protein EYC69_09345 [Bacteroidota bacterium]